MYYKTDMNNKEECINITKKAMEDPQTGDLFTKEYRRWIYIIKSSKYYVMTHEGIINNMFSYIYRKKDFIKKYSTSSQFTIKLLSRGNEIDWFYNLYNNVSNYMEKRKQIFLNTKMFEWDKVQELLDDIGEILENMREEEWEIVKLEREWEEVHENSSII